MPGKTGEPRHSQSVDLQTTGGFFQAESNSWGRADGPWYVPFPAPHLPEPQPHSLFPRSASKGSHLGTSPLAPSHGASDANLSLEDTLVNLWIHSKRSWGEDGGAWGTAGNWIQIIHRLLFGVFVRVPRITQYWPPERWLYVITRGWGFQGPQGVCFESLRCPGCCAISCHQCLL